MLFDFVKFFSRKMMLLMVRLEKEQKKSKLGTGLCEKCKISRVSWEWETILLSNEFGQTKIFLKLNVTVEETDR